MLPVQRIRLTESANCALSAPHARTRLHLVKNMAGQSCAALCGAARQSGAATERRLWATTRELDSWRDFTKLKLNSLKKVRQH